MPRRLLAILCILAGLGLAVGALVTGPSTFAAGVNAGLTPEVESAIGLGTTDPRVAVARIIRIFMGLLGIIAVSLIIYGGVLWMTSAGNEEQVDKARKVIIGAVIGLAIILAAFSIVSFVLSALTKATGAVPGTGGVGGSGATLSCIARPPDGCPADSFPDPERPNELCCTQNSNLSGVSIASEAAFIVLGFSPTGAVPLRNVVVRAVLSKDVDPATVVNAMQVTTAGGEPVAGTMTTAGAIVEFTPEAACPEPNQDRRCLAANADFRVTITDAVTTPDGEPLACAPQDPRCTGLFHTGELVDVSAPSVVEILSPDDGQSVIQGNQMPVQVRAADDAGIGALDMLVDGNVIGHAVSNGPTADFTAIAVWDSSEAAVGEHAVGAAAVDLDSNTAQATPVTVVVRPISCGNGLQDAEEGGIDCGGSCGACGGGECAANNACASGVCRAGICADSPRIDAMSPGDGGAGTLVTLSGVGFGDRPGQIIFLGEIAEGDEVTAELCAATAWSEREITVTLPAGAHSGAVRVVTAAGEADDTNDTRGPALTDFVVNDRVHPGICTLQPLSGKSGDQVTLGGLGFGADQDAASRLFFTLDGRDISAGNHAPEAWDDARIQTTVPLFTVAAAVRGAVRVRVGGLDSNIRTFTLQTPEAGTRPEITALSPGSGPVDEYVTITGRNFGTRIGTVHFSLSDGTVADASVDFPAACTNNTWSDTTVTVKVPGFYRGARGRTPLALGAHSVVVRRSDAAESASAAFTVTDDPLRPGLCAIDPDNGPAGTVVRVTGERFGSTPGTVSFSPAVPATAVGRWQDRDISQIQVPDAAQTGPVTVAVADQVSNSLTFTVGSCTNGASCSAGRSCCGDGICRASCGGAGGSTPQGGAFMWRFSTGLISSLPHVIEQSSCTTETQSPTPYRDTRDACVNALVSLRFSEEMDPSAVTSFRLRTCGSSESFDPTACGDSTVSGRAAVVRSAALAGTTPRYESQLTFTPTAVLVAGTWYEGVVAGDARSTSGVLLDGDGDGSPGGDYVFSFRTRAASDPCGVDHVTVTPGQFTATNSHEQVDYLGGATAGNCNLLQCSAFTWDWSAQLVGGGDASSAVSLNDATGGEAPPNSCAYTATALNETDPDHPVEIRAAIPSAGVSGTGLLSIHYVEPRIMRTQPGCATACVNSAIGADFNIALDPATLTPSTVQLFTCRNESCREMEEPAGLAGFEVVGRADAAGRMVGVSLTPQAGVALRRSTYYRAVVHGGPAGVRSLSGAELTGGNNGADYVWIFRTRDDASACDVDRVVVSPPVGSVSMLGDVVHYTVTAYGSGDDCTTEGQALAASSYRWDWQVANADQSLPVAVATVDFAETGGKDVLPLAEGQFCSNACLLTGSAASASVCGNGTLERGEDCDDRNITSGDGCSNRCLDEGSLGGAVCGNRLRETGEDCDDGNTVNGDGCSNRCLHEGAAAGGAVCGNRDLGDGEDCDDGNTTSGDGCSSLCLSEGSRPGPLSVCGNGTRESGEACDDGNGSSGDGCSNRCLLEGNDVLCDALTGVGCCGNAVLERPQGESCDDGNATGGDGCSNRCVLEGANARYGLARATASYCGDTVPGLGEQCEFPPPAGDGRPDPDAFVRAAAGGDAVVRAAVTTQAGDTVTGEARFSAACSCQADSDCAALVPGGSPTAFGCGAGRCCAPRPTVHAEFLPEDGATDVCRNTAIRVRFSSLMDHESISENIVLAAQQTEPCAAGSESGIDGFCLVAPRAVPALSQERLPTGALVTAVELRLAQSLAANTAYRVIVRGDNDLNDATAAGVRSTSGVALANDVSWIFTTGPSICTLNSVRVRPTSYLFTTATNNPADDAPGAAYDSINDNDKVYLAEALSSRGGRGEEVIVPTDSYTWAWRWASTDGNDKPPADPKYEPPKHFQRPVAGTADLILRTLPSPQNGQATIAATATVTVNAMGEACDGAAPITEQERACGRGMRCAAPGTPAAGHCYGETKSGSARAAVMLCENPWPARGADGSWSPYTNEAYTFSMFYCRDQGRAHVTSDDLPALPEVGQPLQRSVAVPLLQSDLLFPIACGSTDAACQSGDAIGVRILANPSHLKASRWYTNQRFSGQPVATTVDGYEAIQDGRSVYVNAANQAPDGRLYTNVYLFSYNEGANETTQEINRQLLTNTQFNSNLTEQNTQVCSVHSCSGNANRACVVDADCGITDTEEDDGACGGKTCTADVDCSFGGSCQAPKDKLARDVKRYQDMAELSLSLEGYYALHRTCSGAPSESCFDDAYCQARGFGDRCVGTYPTLAAGSFIRGMSTSRWPSWQGGLGNALSVAVPQDPLNTFAAGRDTGSACAEADGYDTSTCWNEGARTYQCPADSHIYSYRKAGRGYEMGTEFEFRFCSDAPTQVCSRDSDCATGACVMSNWNTILAPVSHEAQGIVNTFRYDHICTATAGDTPGTVLAAAAGSCGDGAVGPGEECEVGDTELERCDAGGVPGIRRWTCSNSCTIDRPACVPGRCGDGITQPPETCDDGSLNGSYGHCGITCSNLSGHCGDGSVQTGEACDFGGRCSASGAACATDAECPATEQCLGSTRYALGSTQSCAADCRRPGPYCGDRVVDAAYGEECEVGQVQTLACITLIGSRGFTKTRTCSPSCRWTDFSACSVGTSCGDGVRQGPEGCDDGNRVDTDSCTNLCQPNVCGDGKAWRAREECDLGLTNVDASDAAAISRVRASCPYGSSCNFCTTACRNLNVTGGVCGDATISRPYEVCEAGDLRYVTGLTVFTRPVAQCAADCRSACPPTTVATTIEFQPRQPAGRISAAAVDEVTLTSGSNAFDIIIPACRPGTQHSLVADVGFSRAVSIPSTAILFMVELSGMMNVGSTSYAGARLQQFINDHADPGGAIDTLVESFAGFTDRLQLGMLTYRGGGTQPEVIRTTNDYLPGGGDFRSAADVTTASAFKGAIRTFEAGSVRRAETAAERARAMLNSVEADRKVLVFVSTGDFTAGVSSGGTHEDAIDTPTEVLRAMRTEDGVTIYTLTYSSEDLALLQAASMASGPTYTHKEPDGSAAPLYTRMSNNLTGSAPMGSMMLMIGDPAGRVPAFTIGTGGGVPLIPAYFPPGFSCNGLPQNLPITATFSGDGQLRLSSGHLNACPVSPGG